MGEDGWAFDVLRGFGRYNTGDDSRRGARWVEDELERDLDGEYLDGEYLDEEDWAGALGV